jgi:hypothetical protein
MTEPKGRDFSGDLQEYLSGWEQKATATWKFNKVLQAWALSHAFDSDKIDDDLFLQLCPYLESVQGEILAFDTAGCVCLPVAGLICVYVNMLGAVCVFLCVCVSLSLSLSLHA